MSRISEISLLIQVWVTEIGYGDPNIFYINIFYINVLVALSYDHLSEKHLDRYVREFTGLGRRMKPIEGTLGALLLAAGCGWAVWLTTGARADGIAAAALGLAVSASFAAYMATDRKDAGLWLRFGLYGGSLAVSVASLWTGAVRPLQHAPSFSAAMAWLQALDGLGLVMLVVPPPAAAAPTPTFTAGPRCWTAASCAGSRDAGASCSASGGRGGTRR